MDKNRLTEYLDSLLNEGIPSVDCMVCRNHEIIYRHMNGTIDYDKSIKVKPDTLYMVFSMTKIQTMTAVMQLVEKGKLSLEDEVGKFLPAYNEIYVADSSDGEKRKAKNKLLIKHLLSMQSGLNYNLNRGGINRILREKGDAASTRELVDSFVESPFSFEPGTHFQYSLSHDVAAAVIEAVTGMKFGDYLEENIWKPLGMKNTYFAEPMNSGDRLAAQFIYNDQNSKIEKMDMSCCYQLSKAYQSGGAGLISCTEDYMKLGDTLSNGGISEKGVKIIEKDTIDLIRTNLLGEDSLKDIENNMGRRGYGYGCGMQILMHPELIGSPAPAGLFGWDGAAGSCMIMHPESGTTLVFAMHVRGYGPAYSIIHPKLRDMVFGC